MEGGRQHSLLPAKLEQEKEAGRAERPRLATLEPNTSAEKGPAEYVCAQDDVTSSHILHVNLQAI